MAVKNPKRNNVQAGTSYAKAKQLESICFSLKAKGHQTREIAETLGLPQTKVTTLLRRMNTKLAAMVDGWDELERRVELARIDQNIVRLSKIAEDAYELYSSLRESDGLPATEEEVAAAREAYYSASDRLQKAGERRAKMLGLDVVKERDGNSGPTKVEIALVSVNGPQAVTQTSKIEVIDVTPEPQCLPAPEPQSELSFQPSTQDSSK